MCKVWSRTWLLPSCDELTKSGQECFLPVQSSAEDGGPRLGIASINLSPAQLPDAASAEEQEEDEEEVSCLMRQLLL